MLVGQFEALLKMLVCHLRREAATQLAQLTSDTLHRFDKWDGIYKNNITDNILRRDTDICFTQPSWLDEEKSLVDLDPKKEFFFCSAISTFRVDILMPIQ